MVELNPQALLAALEANHAHKADPGRKGCGIEKAIRAYLSALPAPDDGLVERLRAHADTPIEDELKYIQIADDLMQDAATALQSKDEQIEKLTREKAYWQKQHDDRTRFLGECATEKEAAEQQVQKLTAENERLRGVLEAADYLIDRLRNAWFGNSVHDMDEAEVAYTTASSALETQEGGK